METTSSLKAEVQRWIEAMQSHSFDLAALQQVRPVFAVVQRDVATAATPPGNLCLDQVEHECMLLDKEDVKIDALLQVQDLNEVLAHVIRLEEFTLGVTERNDICFRVKRFCLVSAECVCGRRGPICAAKVGVADSELSLLENISREENYSSDEEYWNENTFGLLPELDSIQEKEDLDEAIAPQIVHVVEEQEEESKKEKPKTRRSVVEKAPRKKKKLQNWLEIYW